MRRSRKRHWEEGPPTADRSVPPGFKRPAWADALGYTDQQAAATLKGLRRTTEMRDKIRRQLWKAYVKALADLPPNFDWVSVMERRSAAEDAEDRESEQQGTIA